VKTCPKCSREWQEPCEQTNCIERFGECIPCRFLPVGENNPYGSGVGTKDELDALTTTDEARGL